MPIYTFYDSKADEVWDEMMSYDDMEKLTANGDIVMVPQAIRLGYTTQTKHPDDTFRDILREMKKKPGIKGRNTINVI